MENPLSPEIWQQLHQGHQTLTGAQETQFLTAASQFDPQTRALCELLFWTGCRLSEALALKRDHIDTERQFVVLHTLKQRNRPALRAVPVPHGLIEALYSLPTDACGRFWPYSRWTARRRLQPVFEAAELANIQATSRVFRHSYNARAIRHGLSDRVRRTLLGHRTQSANNQYGHLVGYELHHFAAQMWQEAS